MRCGAKCFVVQYELDGETKSMEVNTRTSAEARKVLRTETNGKGKVIQVKAQKQRYLTNFRSKWLYKFPVNGQY